MQYSVLIGLYITLIPFYIAIYQALKLLNLIDHNQAFLDAICKALDCQPGDILEYRQDEEL